MTQRMFATSLLVVLATLAACGRGATATGKQDLSQAADRFVPSDAANKVIAAGVPWAQIDFTAPFEFAFDERAITSANAEGWLLCSPKSEKWWEYEDRSVTPARYLQQRVFMLFKNDVLVTLLGRYVSTSEQEAVKSSSLGSDKPLQQGVVSARKLSQKEAREIAESFDLYCAGTG